MPVRALDRAVLMGHAEVVAGRRHAVMRDERLVALRLIRLRIAVEIAERRRQTVAAVLLWDSAERPQRVLQPLGKRHEALATEHDMGMLEAGERQPEVIQAMR